MLAEWMTSYEQAIFIMMLDGYICHAAKSYATRNEHVFGNRSECRRQESDLIGSRFLFESTYAEEHCA